MDRGSRNGTHVVRGSHFSFAEHTLMDQVPLQLGDGCIGTMETDSPACRVKDAADLDGVGGTKKGDSVLSKVAEEKHSRRVPRGIIVRSNKKKKLLFNSNLNSHVC